MILLEDAIAIHQFSIDKYAGGNGTRDIGGLEAAIARPFQTFSGEDLYPTIFEKAAALCESLIINHPFIDGNKRSGFLAMAALLQEDGFRLTASQQAAYDFIVQISTGETRFEAMVIWLKENTLPV